jgi:integrase
MNTTDRTFESYQSNIERHLIPELGKITLSELRPQNIQHYYAKALSGGRIDGKGGLSARSVVYHHRILSKALDYAVKMGLLVRNVVKMVDPPRIKRVKMNTLSPEEVTSFLEAAKESPHYVYFAMLLYTGLRRGELLAMRWRNLDLNKGTLRVVETGYQLRNGKSIIKEPKTPHSKRNVTMPSSLVELLKLYR